MKVPLQILQTSEEFRFSRRIVRVIRLNNGREYHEYSVWDNDTQTFCGDMTLLEDREDKREVERYIFHMNVENVYYTRLLRSYILNM